MYVVYCYQLVAMSTTTSVWTTFFFSKFQRRLRVTLLDPPYRPPGNYECYFKSLWTKWGDSLDFQGLANMSLSSIFPSLYLQELLHVLLASLYSQGQLLPPRLPVATPCRSPQFLPRLARNPFTLSFSEIGSFHFPRNTCSTTVMLASIFSTQSSSSNPDTLFIMCHSMYGERIGSSRISMRASHSLSNWTWARFSACSIVMGWVMARVRLRGRWMVVS